MDVRLLTVVVLPSEPFFQLQRFHLLASQVPSAHVFFEKHVKTFMNPVNQVNIPMRCLVFPHVEKETLDIGDNLLIYIQLNLHL